MKTKKLKLNDLQVSSFVTEMNEVNGGMAEINLTIISPTYFCSVHQCPASVPIDTCNVITINSPCPTNPVLTCQLPTVHKECGSNPIVSCLTKMIALDI